VVVVANSVVIFEIQDDLTVMGIPARGSWPGGGASHFSKRGIECEVIFSQALVTQSERVQILLLQLHLMKIL